jgi:hypothetical protein
MPIQLKDVLGNKRTITATWRDGEEFSITYDQGAYTPTLQSEMVAKAEAGEIDNAETALVLVLVKEWDLIGEDGKPVPITQEAVEKVPMVILNFVLGEIAGDISGNPTSTNRANRRAKKRPRSFDGS